MGETMVDGKVVWSYSKAKAAADRIRWAVHERCKKLAREAHLDPGMYSLHAHNALVSLHYGQPWKEVDYSKARQIQWLEREKMFAGTRLVESYVRNRLAKGYDVVLMRRDVTNQYYREAHGQMELGI